MLALLCDKHTGISEARMEEKAFCIYIGISGKKVCVMALFFWISFLRALEKIKKYFKMCLKYPGQLCYIEAKPDFDRCCID